MRIFNEEKTTELAQEAADLASGYLKEDKLFIAHHDAHDSAPGVSHYETVKEYKNEKGEVYGKEVIEIFDIEPQEAREAYDEYENILVYIPYTDEEQREIAAEKLRIKRKEVCYSVINRGKLWYDTLTDEQYMELVEWYYAWLDAPSTLEEPETPEWVNGTVNKETTEVL